MLQCVQILPNAGEDGQETFTCPVCEELLPSNHDLTKHIRSHNLVPPLASTSNACTICGKILSSQSSLDRHMLVHSGLYTVHYIRKQNVIQQEAQLLLGLPTVLPGNL